MEAKECRRRSREAEARGDVAKALYWSRREVGEQPLPSRMLFRSLAIEVISPGDRSRAIEPVYRYHPATAARMAKSKCRAVRHPSYRLLNGVHVYDAAKKAA